MNDIPMIPKVDNREINAIKDIQIDQEALNKLSEIDRTYVLLDTGMKIINSINKLEVAIHEMKKMVRLLIPEPIEDLKILISRLEDINAKQVDHLSLGFIKQTFTINGKELKVSMPEVGEVKDLEFYRLVISQIKVADETTAVSIEAIKELKTKYDTLIPDEVKKLLSNMESVDEWMIEYINSKIRDSETTPEARAKYEKKLQYIDYSYTLQPLIDSLTKQIEAKGNQSILYGYKNNSTDVLTTAINVCKNHGIQFPFQMFDRVEEVLLGDKYKDYPNLFSFLLARYIKFIKNTMTDNDKLFLSNLHSHLVIIKRTKDLSKVEKTASRLKISIDKVLELVTK